MIFYVAEEFGDFVELEGDVLFYDAFRNHIRSSTLEGLDGPSAFWPPMLVFECPFLPLTRLRSA